MVWVETDGTVYWATAENAIPTHGDGANRNDNKYVDNSRTYHAVVKTNTVGVEFAGNFPDVAKPPTADQTRAWLILVRFLQERYGIPPEHIYAHNGSITKIALLRGLRTRDQGAKADYRPTTGAPPTGRIERKRAAATGITSGVARRLRRSLISRQTTSSVNVQAAAADEIWQIPNDILNE